MPSAETRLDYAVIGAGPAGLIAAAVLASRGKRVALFDRQPVGGSMRFASWIGGLAGDSWLKGALQAAGAWSHLKPEPRDPVFAAVFPNHRWVAPADAEGLRHELSALWPGEAENIRTCLDELAQMGRSFLSLVDGPATTGPLARWQDATLREFLQSHTRHEEVQAALAVLWPLAGLSPSRLSAVHYAMLWQTYYLQGGLTVSGLSLRDALLKALKEQGGRVESVPVTRILRRRGRVTGVQLADGREWRDVRVICTASPHDTFEDLLHSPGETPAGYDPLRRFVTSSSLLRVNVPGPSLLAPTVIHHTTYDQDEAYRDLQVTDPEFQVWMVSAAGEGRLHIDTPSPYGRTDHWQVSYSRRRLPEIERDEEDYIELRDHLGRRLAKRALRALEESAAAPAPEDIWTPLRLETETWNAGGAVGGWACVPEQAGYRRPGPLTPFQNLYLAGHWVFPGGGVSAAAVSGQLAALCALRDES